MSARIVCQVDYCARVDCAVVDKTDCEVNKDGIFAERGGWCGCCPTCLHKIREILINYKLFNLCYK